MKVTFTQGILSGMKNSLGNPAFLEVTPQGIVNQIARTTPTVLILAHRSTNYVININKDVAPAWGSFEDIATPYWLYWDINFVTGRISRGFTAYEPIYSATAPTTALEIGQHWFDLTNNTFFEWTGSEWMERIRIFAGVLHHNVISYYPMGTSQAGLNGDYYAGYIMFDENNRPLRVQNNGFLTTETVTTVRTSTGISTVKLDQNIMVFEAAEPIPAYSLVYVSGEDKIRLADTTDMDKAAIGVVDSPAPPGTAVNVIFRGQITSENWSTALDDSAIEFTADQIGKQLYLGKSGKIVFHPPLIFAQKIGTVVGTHSIYLDIDEMRSASGSSGSDVIQGPKGDPGPPGGSGFQAIAGDYLGGHRVCLIDNAGKLQYASNTDSTHAQRVVGMTLAAVVTGDTVTMQNFGEIFEPSWDWDISRPVFLGENGILTQEPPAAPTAKFSLVVGFPSTPTTLFINMSQPIFIT